MCGQSCLCHSGSALTSSSYFPLEAGIVYPPSLPSTPSLQSMLHETNHIALRELTILPDEGCYLTVKILL